MIQHDDNRLKLVKLGIDSRQEFIIFMHAHCFIAVIIGGVCVYWAVL